MFHKTLRGFSELRSFLFLYLAMVVLPAKSLIIDDAELERWLDSISGFISVINTCHEDGVIEKDYEITFPWENLPDQEWHIAEEPFKDSFNGDMRNATFTWIRFPGGHGHGMPTPALADLAMKVLAPSSSEDSLQLLLSGNFCLRFYPGTKDLWVHYRGMAVMIFNWLDSFVKDDSWVNIDKKNDYTQWAEKVVKAKKYFQYASTLAWLCHGYVSQKMLQQLVNEMKDLLKAMILISGDISVMEE